MALPIPVEPPVIKTIFCAITPAKKQLFVSRNKPYETINKGRIGEKRA
jgi:hypothetical protein